MKRNWLVLLGVATILVAWLLASGPALAGRVYVMTGTLSAVDLGCNTAVVKVPLGGGKIFVVAGTLAPNVVLKKGGLRARLEDFQPGEKVTVKWRSTDRGHQILALIAR
jgi:hypothetical protein